MRRYNSKQSTLFFFVSAFNIQQSFAAVHKTSKRINTMRFKKTIGKVSN